MLSNPTSLNGHVERGLNEEKVSVHASISSFCVCKSDSLLSQVPDPHSDGQHLDYGDIGKFVTSY